MEHGETYDQGTIREIREELGLSVELFDNKRPDYVNEQFLKDKHYVILASAGYAAEDAHREKNEELVNKWFEYPKDIH